MIPSDSYDLSTDIRSALHCASFDQLAAVEEACGLTPKKDYLHSDRVMALMVRYTFSPGFTYVLIEALSRLRAFPDTREPVTFDAGAAVYEALPTALRSLSVEQLADVVARVDLKEGDSVERVVERCKERLFFLYAVIERLGEFGVEP